VNPDRERALLELTRRNPFWPCVVVFGLLAVDSGFRLANSVQQRNQLDEAERVQLQNLGQMRQTLVQLPQIEERLKALSLDLMQVATTNAAADQIVREFNIQWTPGPEGFASPSALPPVMPAPVTPAAAIAATGNPATATNAPAAK